MMVVNNLLVRPKIPWGGGFGTGKHPKIPIMGLQTAQSLRVVTISLPKGKYIVSHSQHFSGAKLLWNFLLVYLVSSSKYLEDLYIHPCEKTGSFTLPLEGPIADPKRWKKVLISERCRQDPIQHLKLVANFLGLQAFWAIGFSMGVEKQKVTHLNTQNAIFVGGIWKDLNFISFSFFLTVCLMGMPGLTQTPNLPLEMNMCVESASGWISHCCVFVRFLSYFFSEFKLGCQDWKPEQIFSFVCPFTLARYHQLPTSWPSILK